MALVYSIRCIYTVDIWTVIIFIFAFVPKTQHEALTVLEIKHIMSFRETGQKIIIHNTNIRRKCVGNNLLIGVQSSQII